MSKENKTEPTVPSSSMKEGVLSMMGLNNRKNPRGQSKGITLDRVLNQFDQAMIGLDNLVEQESTNIENIARQQAGLAKRMEAAETVKSKAEKIGDNFRKLLDVK